MPNPLVTTNISLLANAFAPTATGSVYTNASGSAKNIISSIILFNSTASPVLVKLWLVPSGGGASAQNQFYEYTIATKQTLEIDTKLIVGPGSSIQASAGTASSISVFINGNTFDLAS